MSDLRAAVEALAEEWDADIRAVRGEGVTSGHAAQLRAFLAAHATSSGPEDGGLSDEALDEFVDAIWDAQDAAHDEAWHVHAAECCWSFPGARIAILDVLRARLAAAGRGAVDARAEGERIARAIEVKCTHDGRNGRTWCCAACHDAARIARGDA